MKDSSMISMAKTIKFNKITKFMLLKRRIQEQTFWSRKEDWSSLDKTKKSKGAFMAGVKIWLFSVVEMKDFFHPTLQLLNYTDKPYPGCVRLSHCPSLICYSY